MPRADHDERRRQIADAVWRVVDRSGFDGVSLRRVAAEAGVSMGLVQHYFPTKDEMLTFAMDAVAEQVGERYAAALAELPDPPPPGAAVRALLVQMLPLDEQRRDAGHALFAFLAEGARSGPVGERMRTGTARLREFVTSQVATTGIDTDPERAATVLLALTDGLAAHVLGGHLAPHDALAALDAHLDDLFDPGPPARLHPVDPAPRD